MQFNKILAIIILILFIYLSIRYLLYHFVDICIFQPGKIELYTLPGTKEVKLRTIDNKNDIYLIQKHNKVRRAHIIFSHGATGNMNNCKHILHTLAKHCSVTMYDYRGYGKSTGNSTEDSLAKDILTVYHYLTKVDRIDNKDIILYGRSLGTYPTLYLAKLLSDKGIKIKHVIIEAGFANTIDIAKSKIGSILANILIIKRLKNSKMIKDVKMPILLSHSPSDEIVAYDNATKLLQKNRNIEHYTLKDQHVDETLHGDYLKKIISIIKRKD